MFNFFQANRLALARLSSIIGRSSRSEFWWCCLSYLFIYIACGVSITYLAFISRTLGRLLSFASAIILLAATVALLIIMIRRLHDRNLSGLWILLLCIPAVGVVFLLVISVLPSTQGTNRFGINPLEDPHGHYDFYTQGKFKTLGAYGAVSNMFKNSPFASEFYQDAPQSPQQVEGAQRKSKI